MLWALFFVSSVGRFACLTSCQLRIQRRVGQSLSINLRIVILGLVFVFGLMLSFRLGLELLFAVSLKRRASRTLYDFYLPYLLCAHSLTLIEISLHFWT